MEENTTKYQFPDIGPDDDTEEMNGVPVYNPKSEEEKVSVEWDFLPDLPEIPRELDLICSPCVEIKNE